MWDLTSRNVEMLTNSWSVSIRHMWKLPPQAHRFLIEPLGGTHAKTMLLTRFIKFIQSIEKGNKCAPLYLLEKIRDDTRTVTGRNICYVMHELEVFDISNIKTKNVKDKYEFRQMSKYDEWKIRIIKELTDMKMGKLSVEFDNGSELTNANIDDIMEFVTRC